MFFTVRGIGGNPHLLIIADIGKHIPASQGRTSEREIRESTIMPVLACGGAISFDDSKKACYSCSIVDLSVRVYTHSTNDRKSLSPH
jgi:hypothetical protein